MDSAVSDLVSRLREHTSDGYSPIGGEAADEIERLERQVKVLNPPEGFTIQEWHVAQVYTYLLWIDDDVREGDEAATRKWRERLTMFEDRFPEQVKKFADYMGWQRKADRPPGTDPGTPPRTHTSRDG